MKKTIGIALSMLLLFCAYGNPVPARAAGEGGDFFKGKTLTYIVATKAGGGYDSYARLIAEYMAKHLGAEIRVKNIPGAGNIVGANQLYIARPDGLTIGTFNTGLIYAQLLKRPGVEFDLKRMSWIGSAARDARVIVMSKQSGIGSLEDLRASSAPVLFGSSGVGSASHNEMTLIARALGLNIRMVPGFAGSEGEMSMMRGEIAGLLASHSSLRPFVDNGYGRFIGRIGGDDGDLPRIADFAIDANGARLLKLIEAMTQLARLTAGPPGISAPRLALLRRAYLDALHDPALLERAAKLAIPIEPMPGEEVAEFVAAALTQPADVMRILEATITVDKN